MAKSVSLQALAGSVEHACGTIADLLVDLGKLVPLAKASLLPVAAECLTAKTVIGKLGVLLAPGGPTDPYAVYGDYNKQVEDLEPCFEVVLHAMSEILVDIDHETTHQTFLTHPSFAKAAEPSRLQPLVAVELHQISGRLDVRSLLAKYRTKSPRSRENDHSLTRMLHHAITGCDHHAVHRCLLAKTSPDTPLEESGVVPIHRALGQVGAALALENKAAIKNSTSIVMALLIAGASLKAQDENGRTPLIRATMNELPDSIISLMLEFGASVTAKDRQRNTALHHAAMRAPSNEMENIDTIRVLLAHGADQSLKNTRGRTPLHEAVLFERFDRGQELLDYGADSEIADNNGWTPLLCAVTQGNVALTKLLCDRGAIVDKKDKNGYTALHYAISHGSEQVSKVLLDAGVDVNLISRGETPLCRATSKSNLRLVKLLLSYGADVTLPSPGYCGALSVHVAAMGRDVAISEALLGAGSPINALDDEGRTPLRWAMDGGKNELVHFLMSKGAAK
ncbi:hypothetical protein Daesc_007119 [Daldinia eschscholtzii]|uniref:Ankyrin repeat protein n=1 Tax=Daldinia eschscholtzii TaxID=292717 RepID=A0AAX6MD80_9PEZI